jgi:hypothetical protein
MRNWYFQNSKDFQTCLDEGLLQMEQTSFLAQPPNLSIFGIIKFRSKFQFESCLNFKGVQTHWEKSHQFRKIQSSHDLQEYEFNWLTCMQNLEVPLQVVNMTWFHNYSKTRFEFEFEL